MGGCCTRGGGDTDSVNTDRNKDKEKESDPLINNNKFDKLSNPYSNRTNKSDTSISSAASDGEVDELHRVNATELGDFVLKKMNNKTLDRLWKHLDEDGSGQIERKEVLNILQWMAVLYVAFRFRV